MYSNRSLIIYQILDIKKVKSEKFEIKKVECYFLIYGKTNYCL